MKSNSLGKMHDDTHACSEAEIVKYLRAQRHDFMNYIQVIWGYLQLNKSDQAKQYIEGLNTKFEIINHILKIENPKLSLYLYNNVRKAYKAGAEVDFDSDLDSMDQHYRFDNALLGELDKIFDITLAQAMQNSCSHKIYIDIYIDGEVLCMLLSNSMCSDFIDSEEQYKRYDCSTDDVNIYSMCYDENVFFKIDIKPFEA